MKINCQAFLEIKKILSIKELDAVIDNFDYIENEKEIKGNIKVTTSCYIDNLDNLNEIVDEVPFNVMFVSDEITLNGIELSIENLVYHPVEGRGIELEFDINIDKKTIMDENVIEVPVEIDDKKSSEEECITNGDVLSERLVTENSTNEIKNEDKICDENEILKDQVIESMDSLLQSKLEQVDDNFPESEQSILTPLKRTYTHVRISFKNNNNRLD